MKPNLEGPLSSYSRVASRIALPPLCLCLLLSLWAAPAHALEVHGVYRTACDRDLGVILKVEKRAIQLLTLEGTIIEVPRHEIVSLVYYPVSKVPIAEFPIAPTTPVLHVETLQNGEVVSLARGWPIDFSETKIAFLLESGKDLIIDKDSMWSLEFSHTLEQGKIAHGDPTHFAHPQTAGFCTPEPGVVGARTVFAQQILNDRVVIKRELDRLQEGYEEILELSGDQKFYPVPHIYKDRTALGVWVSAFSRYGSSSTRTNNFTPMLIDELHLGPFSYQHVFLSGAAPNSQLLHAESQTQIFYRFKAAYFHASVFFDPGIVLVGSKYKWRRADLKDETLDDRVNEIAAVEFGFDYGPIAIEVTPGSVGQAVVKTSEVFESNNTFNLWRAGLRYTHRQWIAQAFAGQSTSNGYSDGNGNSPVSGPSDWLYRYARANFFFDPHSRFGGSASLIYRSLNYDVDNTQATYQSTSLSGALRAHFAIRRRFEVGGQFILETQSRTSSAQRRKRRWLPKLALFTSFSF